ncbi:HNH endonuclease signature motif containing protein [Promicromonospora aerolata]|uniref:HNH endonuclease n=1 Tax=Promicromonospora aerolata TaxID=195749 RepID=A0ABW4V517_9MICO
MTGSPLAGTHQPDWPPDSVPVVLWPEDVLRQALAQVRGVRLARVVAEAVDLGGESGALGGLSDDALGDLMVACGRLQSWAAGVQAHVVAERAARESHVLAHGSLIGQVTGELVVTEPEATEVVVRAESGARHPSVITALTTGQIDVRKAHTLLRSATQLTAAERAEAITRYLPQAPRRTWKWLQTRMLAFAKTRHGTTETTRAAAQHRCVQVDRAENDMGWLTAYLPATDAAAVWGVVDDMAHQLRHATGDDRTLGQLRADSLTGIITGRLLPADRDTDPDRDPDTRDGVDGSSADAAVCTCGGRAPVQQVTVQEIVRPVRITPTRPVLRVTVPASTLLGLDDAPATLDGYGPVPADTARTIAQDATWQRLLTDPTTGILTDYSTTTYRPGKVLRAAVQARDATCTFLGCTTPADHSDLDHIRPFDHTAKNTNGRTDPRGQTNAHNLHALCRKHHLLKTHAGWDVIRDPDTGLTTWTTPTGRTHTRTPTVLDTHVELDQIDPGTSHDLTLHALTGQHLPRAYATTEPGAVQTEPSTRTDPDPPPF